MLSEIARAIVAGTMDVRDASLALSEGQIELIEGMRRQLENLDAIAEELRRIEAAREALLPPVRLLEDFVAFQPDFAMPGGSRSAVSARAALPTYATSLATRLDSGLLPATRSGAVLRSADALANAVVSVNATQPYRDEVGQIATLARYLAYNAANGAVPVAIELSGDADREGQVLTAGHRLILEARAFASALFIIDPKLLSEAAQTTVEGCLGGEAGIDSVPGAAIVCVLVPGCQGGGGGNTLAVPDTVGNVYSAAYKGPVQISHPDYESGLARVLTANPRKALVYHVTRLGSATKIT